MLLSFLLEGSMSRYEPPIARRIASRLASSISCCSAPGAHRAWCSPRLVLTAPGAHRAWCSPRIGSGSDIESRCSRDGS